MSRTLKQNSLAHIVFAAHWNSGDASHTDIKNVEKFNVWRDLELLPHPLQQALLESQVGHRASHRFGAGELVEPYSKAALVTLKQHPLQLHLRSGQPITPQLGRFYPRGLIHGHAGIYSEEMEPMRYIAPQTFDLNHPLASHAVEIEVEILDIYDHADEHGGRCNEVLRELLRAPGMKAPRASPQGESATDFFSGTPFDRIDETDDANFYRKARLVHHLDDTARQQVGALYGRLLQPGMNVLDLMSSWTSHLPETLEGIELTGLGMNEEELAANPRLHSYRQHDLNTLPRLPYEEAGFDAVICSASVEYLTRPFEVFAEVARVLKPGGLFINVFSSRWFPPKVINRWSELHEFERPALVCDYYRHSGSFEAIHTYSETGLSRPIDDPHIRETLLSDPVHAVWATRRPE